MEQLIERPRAAKAKWYGPVRVLMERDLLEQLAHLRRELQLGFPLADDTLFEK